MSHHFRSYVISYLLPLSAVVLIGIGQARVLRQELWASHELRDHLLKQHHDLLVTAEQLKAESQELHEGLVYLKTSLVKLDAVEESLLTPQAKINLILTESLTLLDHRLESLEKTLTH